MDGLDDPCNIEHIGDARGERVLENGTSSSCSNTAYRLFDRERTIRQIMGGGKGYLSVIVLSLWNAFGLLELTNSCILIAADLILWKQRHVSCGIIIVASAAWLLFARSGLSFLSICSDVFLILIVVQFTRANYAAYQNKQIQPLPELELSEEMVNNAAASFRVKINYMLLMAHDITLGKDFRLFFKVVACLWLVSVIGGFFSFLTLVYIGTIVSITIPALYNRYDQQVDRYAGFLHKELSKHYKIVDENVISRLPRSLSKAKDT